MNANPFELFGNAVDNGIIGGADVGAESFVLTLLITILAIIAVVSVALLVAYVINSLGLYRIAKQLGVDQAFLAWIPYANYFLLGKVVEKCDARNGNRVRPWGLIVLLSMIGATLIGAVLGGASSIFSIIPLIGLIISVLASMLSMALSAATLALDCICRWKIYGEYYSDTAKIVLVIVGALFSIQPIITLITSFRQPKDAQSAPIDNVEYTYNA